MKIILTTDTHYGNGGKQTRKNHESYIDLMSQAIKEHDCKAILHTGDWISHRQEQLEKTFELFRSKINIPILGVFGNHDYWNEKFKGHGKFRNMSWENELKYHEELLKKYNITYLTNNPTEIENYIFTGFDGWYKSPPDSNDLNFLPFDINGEPTHIAMAKKAYNDFCDVLELMEKNKENYSNKKRVLLTHFPPIKSGHIDSSWAGDERFYPLIKENFDILCYGHTHDESDYTDENLRIINAGAKYGSPAFIVKEI